MKQRLLAGEEIEVLTPAEARTLAEDIFRANVTDVIRAPANDKTDAAGTIKLKLYTVPLGMEFVLVRLVVNADGYTPGAPYVAAAGYLDVFRSEKRVDFKRLDVSGLPALLTNSSSSGVQARSGEEIAIALVGGPVNTNIEAELQGILRRLPVEVGR